MSDAAPRFGTAAPSVMTPHGGAADAPGLEVFSREARRGGDLVVRMRCVRRGEIFVVDCEVHPQEARSGAGPELRSYSFGDRHEAKLFVDESAQALEYLGCEIA